MTPKRPNSTIRWPVDMGIPFCCGDELAQTGSLEAGGPLVGGLTGGEGRCASSGVGPREKGAGPGGAPEIDGEGAALGVRGARGAGPGRSTAADPTRGETRSASSGPTVIVAARVP